jgi:hypothetical protein
LQLYHKARQHIDAAKQLLQLAQEVPAGKDTPLRMKKIYVLAGLEIESYHEQVGINVTGNCTFEFYSLF